jgi:hypothetical protein
MSTNTTITASTTSTSYIMQQDPAKYGGNQADFEAEGKIVVDKSVELIRAAKNNKKNKNFQNLFHSVIDTLAQARHKIAIAHNDQPGEYAENAHKFGRPRLHSTSDVCQTNLHGSAYQEFNQRMLSTFDEMLKGKIPLDKESNSSPSERKSKDGKCTFKVRAFSQKEVEKFEWDKERHSDLDRAKKALPPFPNTTKVDEKKITPLPKKNKKF